MMNQNARRVIRVTPTITGVQYSNNDVLFDTTEVPLAVGKPGECSKLVSAMVSSKSNSLVDMELFFCTVNQTMGTVNSARSVSDSDWATAKVLGRLTLDSSADNYNYGNGRVHNFDRQSETYSTTYQWKSRFPVLLQAAAGSTSIYTFAFVTGTDVTPEFSVGDLELVLGVEY